MPPLPKDMTRRERKAAKTLRARVPKPSHGGPSKGNSAKVAARPGGLSKTQQKRLVNKGSR